jgi:hypothetical protein
MAAKSLWPATAAQIEAAGYEIGEFGTCSGPHCNAVILWVLTRHRKRMPLQSCGQVGGTGRHIYEPHFASCPDRKRFERPKQPPKPPTPNVIPFRRPQ